MLIEDSQDKQAMEELSNAGHISEKVLQGITDAVLLLSKDFKILWANEAFQNQTGYKREEIIGNHCYRLTHHQEFPCQLPYDLCPIVEAIENGRAATTIHTHFDKEGNKIFVEVSAYPLKDGKGNIVQFVYMNRDITEMKRLEEELRSALVESQKRQAEILALLEGSRAVLKYHDFKGAARSIFDSCKNLIGATSGYIALLNEGGTENEVLFLDSGGLPCTVDSTLPMPIRGLRGEAYHTVKTVYHNDFHRSEWIKFMPEGHVRLENVLFAPMVVEGKAVGLLGIANKPGGFTENDARMASAFAELAAIALLNKWAEEELRRTRDELEMRVEERTKELANINEELVKSERKYRTLIEQASDGIFILDRQLNIIDVNSMGCQMLGFALEELLCLNVRDITSEEELGDVPLLRKRILSGEIVVFERKALRKDGTFIDIEASAKMLEEGLVQAIMRDITERKQAESRINATNALLKLFIKKSSRQEYLESVVELIRNWSGCRCVGIRVLDTYGNIPFESYVGYSQEFWESENWLTIQEHKCACIRVIQEKLEPQDLPAMTSGGSFRCDNTTKFFSALSEEEKGRFRGVCLQSGFISLAIIPIRYQEDVIGAIHLADEREGMMPMKTAEFIESISPLIGEAVHRFSTEEELMKYQYHLEDLVEERTALLKAATEKLQLEITERERAAEEVLRTKTYLESILNNSMDLIVTIKRDGTIGYLNPQSEIMTGYRPEDVKGRHFMEFIPEHLKEFMFEKREEINKGISSKYETEIIKADGTLMHCLISQSRVEAFDEILVTLKDITERKKMEEALLRSYGELETRVKERTAELEKLTEELWNEIAERKRIEEALRRNEATLTEAQRIAHLGNWDWNIQTNQLYWSDEIYRIFGLSPQQFGATYEAFLDSVHPDDREFVKKAVHEALFEGKHYGIEHRIVLPDGTVRIVHEQAEVTFNEADKPIRLIGTVQDITDSKKAEQELMKSYEQLRTLSAHLQSVREEERTNIAREIHDELGQVLTALKIDVSMLANKLYPDSKLLEKTESMIMRIDETIQSVKRICAELRPTILDHFGLSAAIEWQAEEFESRMGIKCDVSFEPREIILDKDITTSVFRVFQEALTNVVRHANATEVRVSLRLKDDKIMLEVKDNGKGITEEQFSDSRSFGLIGIRERVNFFGGDVKINGIRDKGTTITISIPLRKKEEPYDQNINC